MHEAGSRTYMLHTGGAIHERQQTRTRRPRGGRDTQHTQTGVTAELLAERGDERLLPERGAQHLGFPTISRGVAAAGGVDPADVGWPRTGGAERRATGALAPLPTDAREARARPLR